MVVRGRWCRSLPARWECLSKHPARKNAAAAALTVHQRCALGRTSYGEASGEEPCTPLPCREAHGAGPHDGEAGHAAANIEAEADKPSDKVKGSQTRLGNAELDVVARALALRREGRASTMAQGRDKLATRRELCARRCQSREREK